jgi:hypothetical protein
MLLPYNPLWPNKSATIGRPAQQLGSAQREWMSASAVERCAALLRAAGIET